MTGETVVIDLVPVNDGITVIPNDADQITEDGTAANETTDSGSQVNFDKLDNLESIAQPEKEQGVSASTWIIAIFATIGLVVMVVLTVVALRRGLKGKGEIHQLTTTEAPAQNTERKAENDIENSNGYASGTAFQNPDQSKQ